MDLVHGLNGLRSGQGLEGIGIAAFCVPIVHDGHPGLDAPDEEGVVAGVKPVVVDLVNIDDTHPVVRGDQCRFDVPSQVPEA